MGFVQVLNKAPCLKAAGRQKTNSKPQLNSKHQGPKFQLCLYLKIAGLEFDKWCLVLNCHLGFGIWYGDAVLSTRSHFTTLKICTPARSIWTCSGLETSITQSVFEDFDEHQKKQGLWSSFWSIDKTFWSASSTSSPLFLCLQLPAIPDLESTLIDQEHRLPYFEMTVWQIRPTVHQGNSGLTLIGLEHAW